MTQLTDRFGPIPRNITLDGSGNGTLTFQVSGSNARVTNLYVNVSTSVLQAVCTMYKGQVAPSNIIDSTNSGSTGASAKGAIDLMDGETLFVVWSGGDAGATAYATFTGVTIPFSEVGPSHIDWSDPIAAGDGSLVYPALKSPNYVTGSMGWIIRRDGTFELSGGIFRGDIQVTGPNNTSIDIDPSNGQPVIFFNPDNVGPPPATDTIIPGVVYVFTSDFTNQKYSMILASPNPLNGAPAQILLTSANKTNSDQATIEIVGTLKDSQSTLNFHYGITGNGSTAVGAAATSIATTGQTFSFSTPFPVGVTPIVLVNMNNNAANTATWNARAVAISRTGFDIRASGAAPGGTGFTLGFQYAAFAPV